MVPTYVFAEQCSSKLKETPQIYGHAAGSERDCGPAGVRGGAGGRRLGGPPAAQLTTTNLLGGPDIEL